MKTGKFLQSLRKLLQVGALAILLNAGFITSAKAEWCHYVDSLALVEFYNSTNGAGWTESQNWLTGPVSTWEGITVEDGRVTSIRLPFNNLNGTLTYHIGFLQKLTQLSIPGNSVGGSIPDAVIFLSKLEELDLSENQFTGKIPALLGLNLKLQRLNLRQNQLAGNIPVSITLLQNLTLLDLSVNQLTGNIPHGLGFLGKMERMYLTHNQLTGSIPSTFGNLNRVIELFLFNNKLTGAIPSSIGGLDSLVRFNVSQNDLTGSVPSSFASLPKLSVLDVAGNELSGLPNLTAVASLVRLVLNDNRFTFEDLEPNKPKLPGSSFYTPQDSVGTAATVTLCTGDTLVLTADFTGSLPNNRYRWFTTPNIVVTPLTADPVLTIANVQPSHSGTYFARGTNTVATGLSIVRRPVQVTVADCQAGFTSEMRVYPTPFDNEATFHISSEQDEDLEVTVHDKNGQVVETLKGLKTNQELKIGNHLKSGLYYLNAVHGDKKEMIRIIKK